MTDTDTTADASDQAPQHIDPVALFERRDGTTDVETTRIRDDSHYEMRAGITGIAIIGVTNPDGELLLRTPPERDAWHLPHARVERDEDVRVVALQVVRDHLGTDPDQLAVRQVRRVDALQSGSPAESLAKTTEDPDELADATGYARNHDVVFDAQVTDQVDLSTVDCEHDLAWFDDHPDIPEGPMRDDVRLFAD